jgi:hypothetical protein
MVSEAFTFGLGNVHPSSTSPTRATKAGWTFPVEEGRCVEGMSQRTPGFLLMELHLTNIYWAPTVRQAWFRCLRPLWQGHSWGEERGTQTTEAATWSPGNSQRSPGAMGLGRIKEQQETLCTWGAVKRGSGMGSDGRDRRAVTAASGCVPCFITHCPTWGQPIFQMRPDRDMASQAQSSR